MQRRSFVKACALGAGYASLNPALVLGSDDLRPRSYERVQLLDGRGEPLRPGSIKAGRNYVFHYPFTATPAFLLDLGQVIQGHNGLKTEGGKHYSWPGGVGPGQSLVAFSAICAHKLAHPTPQVSYIGFRDRRGEEEPEAGVIACCADNSSYDPARGASVLGGPAKQPLAAVLLDYVVEEDALYATGTLGGEVFERFFDAFEARLSLEYPDSDANARIQGTADVVPMEHFSGNIMRC